MKPRAGLHALAWLLLAASLPVAAAVADVQTDADAAVRIAAPAEHRRGEEQTYLTYPEWFLVHSPAEYARFIAVRPPSAFPYFGHIGQFWTGYAAMNAAMKGRYPVNWGYHLMVLVIGTSTTVEYALKAGYERVIGRFFEGPPQAMTAEDHFAARTAQAYVDFINVQPWYEFDFAGRLQALWTQVPLRGERMGRKWERRFALTTEYGVKALYGWLIGVATRSGYERPIPFTAVLVDGVRAQALTDAGQKVLAERADGRVLALLPRYAAFTTAARSLAGQGADFVEIAGNRGVIVTSLLVDDAWTPPQVAHEVLLEQPILSEPGTRREVLRTRVADLSALLRAEAGRARIEHIYDY